MTVKDKVVESLRTGDGALHYYKQQVTKMRPSGKPGQFLGLCPFHNDHTPSLSIDTSTGQFHCFSPTCGVKGDIFEFRQRREGIDFTECLQRFAAEQGIETARKTEFHGRARGKFTLKDITAWHENLFKPQFSHVKRFLHERRGFSEDTLRGHHIGYDPKRGFIVLPLRSDSDHDLRIKFFKYDFSTGGRVSVQTQGEAVLFGEELLGDHKPEQEPVLVAEGEWDALLLRQFGFLAVTSTAGAATWKREWTPLLKGLPVAVCLDSDQAGRDGAAKIIRELAGVAVSVKKIDLYPGSTSHDRKDVTDWLVKEEHTAEEIRTLIEQAPFVGDLPSESQGTFLRELEHAKEPLQVYPAQDFVEGVLYYTVKLPNLAPYLITSGGRLIPFPECEKEGITLLAKDVDQFNFSRAGIRQFFELLKREEEINPWKIFSNLQYYLRRFVVLRDPDLYQLLALWIMGTYVFRIFQYYPYLHFQGEKRTGKSLVMGLMAKVSFNGQVSVSSTEAVVFRETQANEGAQFFDEAENFTKGASDRDRAVMDVLRQGFMKGGMVKRCGGKDKDKVMRFSAYSAKALGGINELDEVLRDRTIRIPMHRRLESEKVESYRENREMRQFQEHVRDSLYMFGLQFGAQIAEVYTDHGEEVRGVKELYNREYDIWCPLMVLANTVDVARSEKPEATAGAESEMPTTDAMVRLCRVKSSERAADDAQDNKTSRILAVLQRLLRERTPYEASGDSCLYTTDSVLEFFRAQEETSWIEKKSFLTKNLTRLGVGVLHKFVDGKTRKFYLIEKSKVMEFCARYGIAPETTVSVMESVIPENGQ